MTEKTKPQQNLDEEEQWEEVDAPNFVQFKELGDKVSGKLVDKGVSEQYKFGLFTLIQKDGTQIRFHGSAQLDDLMLAVDINDEILVKYIDNQKMAKGNMKLFSVKKR